METENTLKVLGVKSLKEMVTDSSFVSLSVSLFSVRCLQRKSAHLNSMLFIVRSHSSECMLLIEEFLKYVTHTQKQLEKEICSNWIPIYVQELAAW